MGGQNSRRRALQTTYPSREALVYQQTPFCFQDMHGAAAADRAQAEARGHEPPVSPDREHKPKSDSSPGDATAGPPTKPPSGPPPGLAPPSGSNGPPGMHPPGAEQWAFGQMPAIQPGTNSGVPIMDGSQPHMSSLGMPQ
eukprot:scaffold538259_cov42-Prasinocladus_malaysianus.AAC.1